MPNPEGTPIWYELLTADPDASKAFYDHVIGWTVEAQPSGEMDYRMISTSGGDNVGGVMRLTDDMKAGGAQPTWLFYIGVDDVDASFAKVKANGGTSLMDPFDIPGVGRLAFVSDPQGMAGLDWGVYGAPETFVLDAAGTIVYKQIGPLDDSAWRTRIAPLIGIKP